MKPSTLDVWVWVLIYGGLLAVSLGVFVARQDEALGTFFGLGGGIASAIGLVLIYVRSRIKDGPGNGAKQ
ncbi:MAG TPA: hypothetical protein VFV25_07030 [Methylibium sp.]